MKVLLIVGFFMMSYSAFSVDIQHFKRTNSFGFENLESAKLDDSLYKNDYRFLFNLGLSLVEEPLTVKPSDNSEKSAVAIDDFLSVHVGLGFYLTERLWVGASSSYVFIDNNFSLGSTIDGRDWRFTKEDNSRGFEDVSIEASYSVVKKERWGISLIPELYIPTGDKDKFIGDDGIGYGLTLAYEKRFNAWQLAMNLGYRYSPNAELGEGLDIDYRNRINTSIGAIFRLYKDKLFLNAELRKFWMLPLGDDQNPNEGYLGLRGRLTDSLAIFGGASIGNFEKADGNSWRYSGGLKWYVGGKEKQPELVEKKQPRRIVVKKKRKKEVVVKVDCNLMKGLGADNRAIILFARDGSQGHQQSIDSFNKVAQVIVSNKGKIENVIVSGHTSSVGDANYNMQLSKKRAKLAVDYLVQNGVDRSMIQAEGFGETKLRNTGDSKESHAMNRRTEVKVNLTKDYSSKCK